MAKSVRERGTIHHAGRVVLGFTAVLSAACVVDTRPGAGTPAGPPPGAAPAQSQSWQSTPAGQPPVAGPPATAPAAAPSPVTGRSAPPRGQPTPLLPAVTLSRRTTPALHG